MPTQTLQTILVIVLLILARSASVAFSAEVSEGDTRARVVNIVGHPKGKIITGIVEYLLYERGRVTLVNGKVWSYELLTREEAAAKKRKEQKLEATRREASERAGAKRLDTGGALKRAKLRDPAFLEQSAKNRAAYWRRFTVAYPEVDVGSEMSAAETEALAEQDENASAANNAVIAARISSITNSIAEQHVRLDVKSTTGKMERRRARRKLAKLEAQLLEQQAKLR